MQHFLKQLLRDSWDYATDHHGRLTVDIRRAVAFATTSTQSTALDLPQGSLVGLRAYVQFLAHALYNPRDRVTQMPKKKRKTQSQIPIEGRDPLGTASPHPPSLMGFAALLAIGALETVV